MRHRKSGRHFNRTGSHRRAMFYNMSKSLIKHETIITTLQKAKELRKYFEPLVTIAKNDSVFSRRRIFAKLRDKQGVKKLFMLSSKRFLDRPGGYIRILKYKVRAGDASIMAVVKLSGDN